MYSKSENWTPEEDALLLAEFPESANNVDYSGSGTFTRIKKSLGAAHLVSDIKQRLRYLKSLETEEPSPSYEGNVNVTMTTPKKSHALTSTSSIDVRAPMTPSFEAAVKARRVTATTRPPTDSLHSSDTESHTSSSFGELSSSATAPRSSARVRRPPAALSDSVVELTPSRREAVKARRVTGQMGFMDSGVGELTPSRREAVKARRVTGQEGVDLKRRIEKSFAAAADVAAKGAVSAVGVGGLGGGGETTLATGVIEFGLKASGAGSVFEFGDGIVSGGGGKVSGVAAASAGNGQQSSVASSNPMLFDSTPYYKPRMSSNLRYSTALTPEAKVAAAAGAGGDEDEIEEVEAVSVVSTRATTPRGKGRAKKMDEEKENAQRDDDGLLVSQESGSHHANIVFTETAPTPPPARGVTGKRRRGGDGTPTRAAAETVAPTPASSREPQRKRLRLSDEVAVVDITGKVAFKAKLGSKDWKKLKLTKTVRSSRHSRVGADIEEEDEEMDEANKDGHRGADERHDDFSAAGLEEERIPVGQRGWLFSILRTFQQRLGISY